MAADSPLFQPADLAGMALPNRLVVAPMTRNRAAADGTPGELMARYYAQRASAGLIVAEAASPNRVGRTYPDTAGIHLPEHVAGWRAVTGAVAAAGGRMVLQLQHGGRVGHPATTGLVPLAPSPVALPGTIHTPTGKQDAVVPREMSAEDIATTVADFAAAARNALDAGFAGVEVHGANGYLLHQFLAPQTNSRTDAHGGSPQRRSRFVLDVVDAVAAAVGPDRVGVRLSPGNAVNGMAESEEDIAALYPDLVSALDERGLAYLHIAYARPEEPLWPEIRRRWSGALMGNPVLSRPDIPADGGLAAAEAMLAAGADLVALGRPFLANPDLVERLRLRAPVNPVRSQYFMYTGGPVGYTDYPALKG